jgi:uncharacterized protein YaiI (UPF0178 family)
MKIWIDADAAPGAIKEIIFRASMRLKLPVVLVANSWIQTPKSRLITAVQVSAGLDVADDYIVANCAPGDLVITADIPLAAEAIEKGALVLRPRGGPLTKSNIQQILTMRNFMDELRGTGVNTGGPPPLDAKDRQAFAGHLDRILTRQLRQKPS